MILEQAECGEPASKKEESKVDKVNSRGGHGFGLGFFFPVIRMACPDIPATSHHTHNQGYQVLRSRVEHTRRDVKILQKLSSWKQQQQVQSMSHPSISRMELLSIFYPQAEIPSPLPCKVSVHDIEILKYEIWHKLPAELYIQITCWTQHLIFFFIMKHSVKFKIFSSHTMFYWLCSCTAACMQQTQGQELLDSPTTSLLQTLRFPLDWTLNIHFLRSKLWGDQTANVTRANKNKSWWDRKSFLHSHAKRKRQIFTWFSLHLFFFSLGK